jgi:hypothetical protein
LLWIQGNTIYNDGIVFDYCSLVFHKY